MTEIADSAWGSTKMLNEKLMRNLTANFEATFTAAHAIATAKSLDYTEQSSWMLFLKYLDDLEHEREQKAELLGNRYEFIIDAKHRWSACCLRSSSCTATTFRS